MLEELRIQNFAIIDRLELTFEHGFNVITGETGAGKSIILDAVELLLGSRVDSSFVRAGADKATVEGVFSLSPHVRGIIVPLLQEAELIDPEDPESRYIVLSREVRRNGRSSARVNGIIVNAEVMREIGEALVDIHGQSAHLSLFRARAHLDLLDKFADLLEVRAGLAKVVTTLHEVQANIRMLVQDKEELLRRADRLRYEIAEIEAAGLKPDEEADIVAERDRLGSSEQLAQLTAEAIQLLDGDENSELPSVVDALMQVATLLARLAKIDPRLTDDYNLSEQLSDGAQELAITLSGYADKIEFNPNRLNMLEERLELIKSLKRRYKTDSIQGILDYAAKAADELNHIEHSEERLNELRAQEEKLLRHIGELCLRLHRGREKAGQALGKRVVQELKDLRMERTQFEVSMILTETPDGCFVNDKRYAFDATGMDKVEFMMSANPGEPLRPLAKVASGGEAARIMLSLKSVLSRADETPLLIFDEIDQGIGGRIGSVVGEKLWSLTDSHQVMVVTHMPQLAGYADRHYHVKKLVKGERTTTQVTLLEEDMQRIHELAAMLGAEGDAGLQSARDILEAARARKRELRQPAEAPQQKSLL